MNSRRFFHASVRLLALLLSCWSYLALSADRLDWKIRTRSETAPGSGRYESAEKTVHWDVSKTAIVICDMWDSRWCKGAAMRVAEMAPAMNATVREARKRGILIIHSPSETMDFYKDTPQRKRALAAPVAKADGEIPRWQRLHPPKEGAFPIDDWDGGCDDIPRC